MRLSANDPNQLTVLLTCEHGGNDVPAAYRQLFEGQKDALESHRGYDIGALGVALQMASRLSTPIIFSTTTRLLIDLNRSLDRPDAFSEYSRDLAPNDRDRIIAEFYKPYRSSVEQVASAVISSGHRLLHIGVHSCTDELHGTTRDLDISLLFDEARPREKELCERWRSQLQRLAPDFRYPFNEPYNGSDDGLTTTLRGEFGPDKYLGIEIELRQSMIKTQPEQQAIGDFLATSAIACVSGSLEDRPLAP